MERIKMVHKLSGNELPFYSLEVNGENVLELLNPYEISINVTAGKIPEVHFSMEVRNIEMDIEGNIVLDKVSVPDWLKPLIYDRLILQLKQYKQVEI